MPSPATARAKTLPSVTLEDLSPKQINTAKIEHKRQSSAARKRAKDQAHLIWYAAYRKKKRMEAAQPTKPNDAIGTALSFTALKGDEEDCLRDFWNVPVVPTYEEAFALGERYAKEFIAFKRNGTSRGSHSFLLSIASDMELTSKAQRDIAAGFFWAIERFLSGEAR